MFSQLPTSRVPRFFLLHNISVTLSQVYIHICTLLLQSLYKAVLGEDCGPHRLLLKFTSSWMFLSVIAVRCFSVSYLYFTWFSLCLARIGREAVWIVITAKLTPLTSPFPFVPFPVAHPFCKLTVRGEELI